MTQIDPKDVDLRPMEESDFGFVLKTLTQSLHKIEPANFIPNHIFFPQQTFILKKIIQNGAYVLMASVKDSPDDLFGYLIADDRIPEHLIIHWMHVKDCWRKMGIAHQLLNAFHYQLKILFLPIILKIFVILKKIFQILHTILISGAK